MSHRRLRPRAHLVHRLIRVGLGLALLPGCAARPPQEAWFTACGTALSVTVVGTKTGAARVLACGGDGRTHWLDAAGQASDGPTHPALGQQVAATDFDGDGVDELVGVAPDGRLTALAQDGTLLWQCELPIAPVLDLVAGRLHGEARPTVVVAGGPPLGVAAVSADGALRWQDPELRNGFAVALSPPEGELDAAVLVGSDGGTVVRYAASGRRVGVAHPEVTPKYLALVGEQVVVAGWPVRGLENLTRVALFTWQWRTLWTHDLGVQATTYGRWLTAADYDGDGQPELAAADGAGNLVWLDLQGAELGRVQAPEPALTLAAGLPDGRGRRPLLVGTASGVRAYLLR